MTPEQEQDLKRSREIDEQWTAPKLLVLTIATLAAAFTVIYTISSMSGGSQVSPLSF